MALVGAGCRGGVPEVGGGAARLEGPGTCQQAEGAEGKEGRADDDDDDDDDSGLGFFDQPRTPGGQVRTRCSRAGNCAHIDALHLAVSCCAVCQR